MSWWNWFFRRNTLTHLDVVPAPPAPHIPPIHDASGYDYNWPPGSDNWDADTKQRYNAQNGLAPYYNRQWLYNPANDSPSMQFFREVDLKFDGYAHIVP